MKDFLNWCLEKNLAEVAADGTVTWKEAAIRGGKSANHKEKIDGPRDGRNDLSGDYKGHVHANGTVWPFKVMAKGKGGKAVAPVGK